ncbi:MAG: lysine--tRNA ligase [Terriglobales bacterium]
MSLDTEILEQRRAKLAEMRAAGGEPYPHRFAFSQALPQVLAEFGGRGGEELETEKRAVKVCGRLMAFRPHGKAGFGQLQQNGARLQIYVRQDGVDEGSFRLWKALDLGDLIGVEGYLFRTRTGELTVHATRLVLLAKDLLPLPEKWHGLVDVEARYRQRYLDLVVNPEVREMFLKRAAMIASLRRQFEARGYIEVETPMMQPLAGGAAARPFRTHHEALDLDLYLRIAPELYLKRLVVGGLDRVYEINRNFRNEGISTQHNPEFTMLEFYEAYSDYRSLMDWSEQLLAQTAREVAGSETVIFRGAEINLGAWRRLSLRDAVLEFWPSGRGAKPGQGDLEGARAVELFEEVAERHLVQPTIIYDFPRAVSPLAKSKPAEPDWVERFELYAGGMEIANGYSELNDPDEQRRRFEQQVAAREGGDAEAHALDEDYIRALQYGLPPTAGEGIGIDRLAMLLSGASSIRDVILFPLLRPEA